ncbi:S41 family peptidase [Candidatus Omnitrophota bacterium]
MSSGLKIAIISIFALLYGCTSTQLILAAHDPEATQKDLQNETPEYYKPYLELLEEVFNKMDEHYYKPVSRKTYEIYVQKYKKSVLSKLPHQDGRIDHIARMGAGLLVNQLRDKEDTFTNFIPPKKAEEYSQKVYGYENGIGISGHRSKEGYVIEHVQIRSDAYEKNIATGDIILTINGVDVLTLNDDEIKELLYPPLDSVITLEILFVKRDEVSKIEVTCKEYFKETITSLATHIPHAYCLKIVSFNRKTADDFKDYVQRFVAEGMELLIVDLMDNPGGPPLAVREMAGVLLPAQQKLFYYKKKNVAQFGLISPESDVHYEGVVMLLINKKSGSASELLAGLLKGYKRALIIGKEPTAGRAFLKSTFKFEDGSMLAMLTGFAYLFDGTKFGLDGVTPSYTVPENIGNVLEFVLNQYKNGALMTIDGFTPLDYEE